MDHYHIESNSKNKKRCAHIICTVDVDAVGERDRLVSKFLEEGEKIKKRGIAITTFNDGTVVKAYSCTGDCANDLEGLNGIYHLTPET